MIGKIFHNRYEIKEKLGSGGMSVVYKGMDTLLNRWVTIKVLREQFANDEDFVRRFRREAQSVASLSHINIVSIYDVGFEEELHYLVMEYVDGQNLKEYIRQKGKLAVHEALCIGIQILDALEHAHEHGVVHRDIKPHNILLTKEGRVKVTDFGIARAASEATVTYAGNLVGSVQYISPEQAKGSVIGAKSDLYGASVVLYEMLTGQLPFVGDSPIAIAMQHIQDDPVPPKQIAPEIPEELSRAILHGMEKNPEHRYASARDMKRDLEKIYLGKTGEVNIVNNNPDLLEDTLEIPGLAGATTYPRKRKIKKPFRKVFIVLGIVTALLLMGGLYAGMMKYLSVEEIEVPNVVGMPLEQAKSELDAAGLTYNPVYQKDDAVKEGYVISQSVAGGSTVKKTKPIDLIISQGPDLTYVPVLIGKNKRDAEIALDNAKLKADFRGEYSDTVPLDAVISQQPDPGDQIPRNSEVIVTVSLGVEAKYFAMPDLIKLTLEEAKSTIQKNGLTLGTVKETESTKYSDGLVISQGVAPGTQVKPGDTVDLEVSSGPGPMANVARVTYQIPDDGQEHRLRLLVSDASGSHVEYDRVQQPGDLIDQEVPYYGTGKVEVYLDQQLKETIPLP